MHLKKLPIILCLLGFFTSKAQIKFNPEIKVDHLTDTLMYPGGPLKYQILFKGGFDQVQTAATYGNPAGTAISKSWNDFIGFTPDASGESLEWNYQYWIPQVDMAKGITGFYEFSKLH